MRKNKFTILFFCIILSFSASAQVDSWNKITSAVPAKAEVIVTSNALITSTVDVFIPGFYLKHQIIDGIDYSSVQMVEGTRSLDRGLPDIDVLPITLAIPNLAVMKTEVLASDFVEFQNVLIAPSKGNLYRNVNPNDVSFKFNDCYKVNQFVPQQQVAMREPFVVRDFRGQTLVVSPFQYNPQSHVLRVYSHLKIEMSTSNVGNLVNPLVNTTSNVNADPDFLAIYKSLFKNFPVLQYNPVNDLGSMLVVCADQWISQIQPLVDWKIKKGISVTVIPASVFGGNAVAIKDQITALYADQGLKYVLLVGDIGQIPSFTAWTGASDPSYGYIVGNDSYAEVFVGRISAESTNDVTTQVDRILHYERSLNASDTWLSKGIVIGSNQGPGDDNEMDWEHESNIRTDLLTSGYQLVDELYDGTHVGTSDAAGDPVAANLINAMQSGASIITYTGHGSTNSFGTTGFSNGNIPSLMNENKLPFIWSVACVNGEFNSTFGPCLAEGLLRATNNNTPIGAVGTFMSSINQSWNPPMDAQDEMVDLLMQAGNSNAIRSIGALSVNGCMLMNDDYGAAGAEMSDTWHVFGDPSLEVRTAAPQVLTVIHTGSLVIGSTSVVVSVNINGAFVAISSAGSVLSTATVNGNVANLSFDALTTVDTLFVTVTGFNMIPYQGYIIVTPASGSYVSVNSHNIDDPSGNNNHQADYNEAINLDLSLINYGSVASGVVDVTVSSNDPYVVLTDSVANVTVVAASSVASLFGEFSFVVANNVPDQHAVTFNVSCVDAGGVTTISTFIVIVNAPIINITNTVYAEGSLSDGDGVIESGEEVNYSLSVSNIGHSAVANIQYAITSSSANITLISGAGNIAALAAGQSTIISCTYLIAPNLAAGTTYDLNNVALAGSYADSLLILQSVGEILETFETADFTYLPWTFAGTKPWIIANDLPFAGAYCSKSDDINDNENSALVIQFSSPVNDSLSLYYMISSEASYDFLKVIVDGLTLHQESGITSWKYLSLAIPAGNHQVVFDYSKDITVSDGSDCAWIDNVRMPTGTTITSLFTQTGYNNGVVYPNPATDVIYIDTKKNRAIKSVEIFTLEGKLMLRNLVNELGKMHLDVSDLPTGIYVIQLSGTDYSCRNKLSIIR